MGTRARMLAPWLLLLVAGAVGWALLGLLGGAGISIAVLALYYAAAGSSFNMVFGALGIFSLAQPVFLAAGAYTGVYMNQNFDVNPWLGLVLGALVAGAIALPIGLASLRSSGAVMTALITLIIAQAAVPIVAGIPALGGSAGLYVDVIGGGSLSQMQFAGGLPFARILLVMNVLIIAGLMWLARSRFGLWLQAIKDAPEAAAASGVPVFRTKLSLFVVSAMVAAPAGYVYAQYNLLVSTELFLSFTALFQVIIVALVGGSARPWGTAVGALVVVWLAQFITSVTNARPGVGPLTFAGVFLVIAVVLPRGLSGTWELLVNRRRRRTVTSDGPPSGGTSDPGVPDRTVAALGPRENVT
ncbi:branched-chain amino acid ABC transporter permease [Oryzobacter telluris]|uniref:branched-chain amino acid ABC transporter permease n=1 Tax=Oryzobacter telluris TaxID=3149179 RepID=UPI00370D6682